MTEPTPAPTILKWNRGGAAAKVEPPPWWAAELQRIFPQHDVPPPTTVASGDWSGGAMRAWKIEPPGTGFLIATVEEDRQVLTWAEDEDAYKNFLTAQLGDDVAGASF